MKVNQNYESWWNLYGLVWKALNSQQSVSMWVTKVGIELHLRFVKCWCHWQWQQVDWDKRVAIVIIFCFPFHSFLFFISWFLFFCEIGRDQEAGNSVGQNSTMRDLPLALIRYCTLAGRGELRFPSPDISNSSISVQPKFGSFKHQTWLNCHCIPSPKQT